MVIGSWLYFLLTLPLFALSIDAAYGQETIIVNATSPCFLNQTAGWHTLETCGIDQDWLEWVVAPWEWITGGFFSGILVGSIVLGTYVKFGKASYSMAVGVIFLPFAFFIFPESFISFAVILAMVAIGMGIIYIFVRQATSR